MDGNIGFHEYINNFILQIYWDILEILVDLLIQNIDETNLIKTKKKKKKSFKKNCRKRNNTYV